MSECVVCVCVCVCTRVRACVYVLSIVSTDTILRYINTSVMYLIKRPIGLSLQ